MTKVRTRTAIKCATETALKASFWIWLLRDNHKWELSTGFKNVSAGNLESNTSMVCKPQDLRISAYNQDKRVIVKKPSKAAQDKRVVVEKVANEPSHSLSVSGKNSSVQPPPGLKNIGSTCYMNSVLQSIHKLIGQGYVKSSPVPRELSKLCQKMKNIRHVVSPTTFWRAFTNDKAAFRPRQPHDANEFFVNLLDLLPEEMLPRKFLFKVQPKLACDSCKHVSISAPEKSFNLIVCCKHKTLNELATESLASEFIAEAKCPSCSEIGSVTKTSNVTLFPHYFAINVKRFKCDGANVTKIFTLIRDPLMPIQIEGNSYSVEAVVCHTGLPDSGHYVALVKDRNFKSWWLCNDSIVTEVDMSKASEEARNGYIFFVKKM